MNFLNSAARRIAFVLASWLVLLVLSCNVAKEDGHTYIVVQMDTAWAAFDSLEITWKDTVSGSEGTLFDGNPADLAATNKMPADGYQGQKIVITFKGYKENTLTYEERRTFDGADPAKVTKEIVPIVVIAPIDSPKVDVLKPKPPRISIISALPDSIISIDDSISFSATATLDSGSLKNYAWSYEGGNGTGFYGPVSGLEGKSAGISGGHRYAKAGTYQVALRVVSDADSIAIARIGVKVLQDPVNPAAGVLSDLTLSAGPIVSAFSPETVVYTLELANSVDSTLVTATAGTAGSTLTINKQPAHSGVGFPMEIPTGVSVITITVTSPGGVSKTYTVIITREKNGNADLSRLVPSADTLIPRFDRNTTAYILAVKNEVGALTPFTLHPEMSAATSTYSITANGVVVEPADLTAPIALRVGGNTLEIKVRAENGESKTYTLSVTRAANGDATLSALAVTPGALDSGFASGDTIYSVAIENATTSLTVTPAKNASTSRITVNGKPVSSGTASEAIALTVGQNAIQVVVTAENQATRTYLLNVTRAKNGNTALSNLVPSVGTLAPVFPANVADYAFQAAFSDSLVCVTPTVADSHSTIQVNGKALASGSASEYQKIMVGENLNRFIIVVTAENLAQKVYNVSVSRSPSSQSALKSLAISHGILAQKSALTYADTVSHGTLNVTLTAVASDPNAAITINSSPVAGGSASPPISLAVGGNEITCLVTAQDGETQTLYAIHVTRLALLGRNLKLGSEVSVLDSLEIPLGRPQPISAPAVTGFHFVNWTIVEGSAVFGDAISSATSATLSLGDARIQANYDTNTYTLAVNASNCTVAKSPDLAAYHHGKPIILTVTPASGYRFSSWSDGNLANPRTVALVANTVLTATCTAIPTYALTLAGAPAGSGSISAIPAGPTYFTGTDVSLTPNPAAGYHFVNWTGDLTGSTLPGAITMTADKSITANFALNQYTLTVTRPPEIPIGCVTTPAGSVIVGHGAPKSITATNCKQGVASCGSGTVYLYYDFSGWTSVSGAPAFASAGSSSTTVTLSTGDATIKANYLAPRSVCE